MAVLTRRIGILLAAMQAGLALAPAFAGAGVFDLPAQGLRSASDFGQYAGQETLLILFQPDCPWCLIQFREASAFAETHVDVQVVAISLRGSRRDLVAELRRARAGFPAYRSSPALLDALGRPEETPRIYLINSDGEVVAERRGMQDRDALAALVE